MIEIARSVRRKRKLLGFGLEKINACIYTRHGEIFATK